MAWRQINVEDVKCGIVIRMKSLEDDGSYCMCTVIQVHPSDVVKVARPYAYASVGGGHLLGSEVFQVPMSEFLSNSDFELFESLKGNIRSLLS